MHVLLLIQDGLTATPLKKYIIKIKQVSLSHSGQFKKKNKVKLLRVCFQNRKKIKPKKKKILIFTVMIFVFYKNKKLNIVAS